MVCKTQQSMAFWYLFDSTKREVGSTNVSLKYLLLRIMVKNLVRKKFYSIALTNFRSETLIMLGIKVMTKLGSVIN